MGNRVAYFNQTSLKFVSPPGICPVFLPLNFYFRVHRRKIFDIFQLRQLRMCPTNTRVFAVALNRRASVCPTARFDAHGIPFNVISTILTMLTCARVNVTVRHSRMTQWWKVARAISATAKPFATIAAYLL